MEAKNRPMLLKNNNITLEVKRGEIPEGYWMTHPYPAGLKVVK